MFDEIVALDNVLLILQKKSCCSDVNKFLFIVKSLLKKRTKENLMNLLKRVKNEKKVYFINNLQLFWSRWRFITFQDTSHEAHKPKAEFAESAESESFLVGAQNVSPKSRIKLKKFHLRKVESSKLYKF